MKVGRAIASAVAAFSLVSFLSGGSCTVSYCSEDCDPCVQQCQCRRVCNHPLSVDFETAHKLAAYRLSVAVEPSGGQVRTFSEIVGLSLALAYGPRENADQDFVRFARGVIQVNPVLGEAKGAAGGGRWTPEPVEIFEACVVVPFQREGSEDRLTFLFDRRGNLVEIDEVRPPSAAEPR